MEAGRELALERIIDGAMPGQAGHGRESAAADVDGVVGLAAGGCASMSMVEMGFVHYLQMVRRKSSNEGGAYAFRACCQFLRH